MRFRSTLILGLAFLALGAYLYFIEFERAAKEGEKKTLFAFEQDDVSAITLSYPDREIKLERQDGEWRLTAPLEVPADETSVENLVRAIAECEIKRQLDDVPEDLAPFGLDKPSATVQVKLKDRELPAIRVGKTSPVGFSTYLQRADQPKVYLTSSAFHSGMDKQVKDLRDKRVLIFSDDEVAGITVHSADRDIVLSKVNGTWQLEKPGPYKADATAVTSFLSTLRNLRATDFPSDEPSDLAAYGLEEPQLTIGLSIGADESKMQLLVGKTEEKEEDVFVKLADRPTVYTVGSWVYDSLDKKANDFRDKTLLAFDTENVTALEIGRGDEGAFVLTRDGETWTMEGEDREPEKSTVDQFVRNLSTLKGHEILADHPEDLGQYGLLSPTLTVTVRGKDDATFGAVKLGSYESEPSEIKHTAMREGDATVLELQEYEFNRLNKKRDDFLPKPTPTARPTATATPKSD